MSRYYDDDEFYIEIQKGSIEDAEELLARLDKIFVKSPYDIFARDDLEAVDTGKFFSILFDDGAIAFKFSNNFLRKDKGECCIDIHNESELGLLVRFVSRNDNGCAVFTLLLIKNKNTLAEFVAVGEGECTLGRFLATLEAMGVSFPNNFPDHLSNFINNCINTYNSLLEQEKVIEDDE